MRINNIVLYNFGSYEEENTFDFRTSEAEKNIILVGGKNGAGKTTLFTAMRLCLYGYLSMGYKNANAFYNRAITKLINNNAKRIRPANAYVEMELALNNTQGIDSYLLKRSWLLEDTLTESFQVVKNGESLPGDKIADFEKYLLSIIPPELFNLFFFDGEKIADFFLEEGGNARIKEAFLTLCGYDTFEIMRKNFKRIGSSQSAVAPMLTSYLAAKETVIDTQKKYQDLSSQLQQCLDDLTSCEADLTSMEKNYHQSGGLDQDEWNQKLITLKEEEKKRETYNALLKRWANDLVPFLMIREKIVALRTQIDKENEVQKLRNFYDVIENPFIKVLIEDKFEALKKEAAKQFGNTEHTILDLSIEENALLISQLSTILNFETAKIEKCKKAIKRSLALTVKTRKELDNSSISSVHEYMEKKAHLFELKSALLVQRVELEEQLMTQKALLQQAEGSLAQIQTKLEDDIKKASISDISARAIIMLDSLQKTLYQRQIQKIEAFFRDEIRILMRKTRFIDDIKIDSDFNTHIYRNEIVEGEKLKEMLACNTEQQLISMIGHAAVQTLYETTKTNHWESLSSFVFEHSEASFYLPIEIDKTSLSNGEKQIFIMALYHSLVQLCNYEIPFIIDTPFARIDTEHRKNISKYFFSKLSGQVFILSTNEEINSDHVRIIDSKVATTYMLENTDNKRTVVVKNQYFEV